MNNTQRIAYLSEKFASANTTMNGLEVKDHYVALHPTVDVPMNISFVDMYKSLVKIAHGKLYYNVVMSIDKA